MSMNLSNSGNANKINAPTILPQIRPEPAKITITAIKIDSWTVKLLGLINVTKWAYKLPANPANDEEIMATRILIVTMFFPSDRTATLSSPTARKILPIGEEVTRCVTNSVKHTNNTVNRRYDSDELNEKRIFQVSGSLATQQARSSHPPSL